MSPEEFWSFNSSAKAKRIIREKAEQIGVDAKALHVLFNTQWNLDGREGSWIEFSEVPPEDLELAKSAGLVQDVFALDHRSLVSKIVKARDKLDRRDVAAAFVSSLTTRRLDTRSTLGSFANALHLTSHRYTAEKGRDECTQCGCPKRHEIRPNHHTFRRIMWAGNVLHGDLGYALSDLSSFGETDVDFGKRDKALLNKIFSSIRKLPKSAGLTELEKSTSGVFPSNKHERQVVLEIFGYCGIIKPTDFPSKHEVWIAKSDFPQPTHFYRKEWRSPASCWTGADGLNHDAIEYWFGDL